MRKPLLAGALLPLLMLLHPAPARAQSVTIVPSCGALALSPGFALGWLYEDTTGKLCTNTTSAPGTATLTSVSVPANTSTLLIAANTTRRSLTIIPALVNTSCLVDISGNTASANSMPIPGGFYWAQLDPVPKSAVYAYCTTAATISVTEIN